MQNNQQMFTPTPTPNLNPTIVLCTLNAKYIHASLGLRYLMANMGELAGQTVLREYTIARQPRDLADELLALQPAIIGFGVYIWNVLETTELVRLLKAARPDVRVVLGGPEVSYEWEQQVIVALADHVITGWGDVSFPKLCRALLYGPQPLMKVLAGEQCELDAIALPYAEYSDADLAHRLLYVEASRGCPFKCEFCLSSLDKTAKPFVLDAFLAAMDSLYQRGARNFKFVDRTFNLKIDASVRILEFFLQRLSDDLFLHFEVVPDHLPDRLKALIAQFPAGVLQLEVGIQSFNESVQHRIARRQDNGKTVANLAWLVRHSQVHLHTDLIFGLPGETLESFAAGFDRLYALQPHEIQLGVLKRLRGTPIARHTHEHGMVYDAQPPYAVQQTAVVDAPTLQRVVRLARYWDMVGNSGRFRASLAVLLQGASPFAAFLSWSDWLWRTSGKTHGLTPEYLVDALFGYLTTAREESADVVRPLLLQDYMSSGAHARPHCLRAVLPRPTMPERGKKARQLALRQDQHARGVNPS
jgi:radical SAM superfamily enzyme YgiQ (UPF0313 family)